ncbi:MAG: alpha/beta hydrolase, partial [Candidatus Roizmanbacteria bacterium]|nr:alpha/beta hydrolase [Candidatus Roizmanbacteria bacterium]
QLGCGKSDRPDDPSLWRLNRFVEELSRVREALGLNRVHIFGFSFGTVVAVEYMLSRQPKGVESLILAGPVLSAQKTQEDAIRLLQQLSPDAYERIVAYESADDLGNPDYIGIKEEFERRHILGEALDPIPASLLESNKNFGEQVYAVMIGNSELNVTGNLKDFNRTEDVGRLGIPILYTCGRQDQMTPETVEKYHRLTPNSEIVVFENSAHMAHFTDKQAYLETLNSFLSRVETSE